MGLGRFGGGVGVTRWLVGEGADVKVTDTAPAESLQKSLADINDLEIDLQLGGHDVRDLDSVDLVIVNPAVDKRHSEYFAEIVRREIPWTTEMNLFCSRCEGRVIAVTGTFGKSTTCAMIYQVLKSADKRGVFLGGNFGRCLLGDLPRIGSDDWVVLELSSAQLEDLGQIHWTPELAVITNLFPHHLDRYSTFSNYVATKLNLLGRAESRFSVVVGPIDRESEPALVERLGVSAPSDRLIRVPASSPSIALSVPGAHNQVNAACALAVCRVVGLDEDLSRKALLSFTGLPHRLEHVRSVAGVKYINDSKATAPAALVSALNAVEGAIIAIVGGMDKGVSLAECAEVLQTKCRSVICVGELGQRFALALRGRDSAGSTVVAGEFAGLEDAVKLANRIAREGDVVLFAPGAPSFDAYANFEERGNHFVELVNAL